MLSSHLDGLILRTNACVHTLGSTEIWIRQGCVVIASATLAKWLITPSQARGWIADGSAAPREAAQTGRSDAAQLVR
jgi:hypothetical protein